MSKKAVIIVAGGTGTRMQLKTAKQFLPIAGRPVILHTLDAFREYDPEMQIIIVLFKDLFSDFHGLLKEYNYHLDFDLTAGGEERFHSVKNGLEKVRAEVELVAVHDAVRPLVSTNTIARTFEDAEKSGAAIPAVPVVDTIRELNENESITLTRSKLRAVQTPQCFKVDLLKSAYNAEYNPVFTDDASVVEAAGHEISIVEGNRTNIKITTREDLLIAEALLRSSS
jgi:2-C-methyl-D-erythritol 4-phosphate cytidylyltransferase